MEPLEITKHIKTRLGVVAVAALVIATGALGTKLTLAQNATQFHFQVGVSNNTTTPAQGEGYPAGQVETECGGWAWRKIAKSSQVQYFDCYPSTATGSFDLTYKARLADDADGNAVYHTGTVTIDCPRSMDIPPPPSTAIGANVALNGSGVSITSSAATCEYSQQQQQPGSDG